LVDERGKGILYLVVTVFLWSTIEVISKPLNDMIDPLWIAFLRFFIGGIFLLPLVFMNWRKVDWTGVGMKHWVLLLVLSLLGITAAFILFHVALTGISATAGATLISTTPLFIAPLSFFILKEKMGYVGMAGILIGALGIMFLVTFEEHHEVRLLSSPFLILMSVLLFSIYTIGMKYLNGRMNPRVTTPLTLLFGALLMLPAIFIKGVPLHAANISLMGWIGIAYLGIIAVGLAYLLYFIGLEDIGASKGASFIYLKPTIAAMLAWPFLGEEPSFVTVISIILISFSVYMVVAEAGLRRFIEWRNGPRLDSASDETDPQVIQSFQDRTVELRNSGDQHPSGHLLREEKVHADRGRDADGH
jgi:drug/metabolite transporter (DMT)-like permease